MSEASGALTYERPSAAPKKEKKKHVHSEMETKAGLTIISALLGGSGASVPSRYLSEPDDTDQTELRRGHKPFRVNMFSHGHPPVLFDETFGVRWAFSSNNPVVDRTRVWIVQHRSPVRMEDTEGACSFCSADVYVVLQPGKGGRSEDFEASFDVFLWVGGEADVAKRCLGAAYASQLQLCLKGHARIWDEREGCESKRFLEVFGGREKFSSAPGPGTESGIVHHESQKSVTRLYCVQHVGGTQILMKQVEPAVASLTVGDYFVLVDDRRRIFLYWHQESGADCRLRGAVFELAQRLKSDFGCRGDVVTKSHPDFVSFWRTLGVEEKRITQEDADALIQANGAGAHHEIYEPIVFALKRVRGTGKPKLVQLEEATTPFDSRLCYVVDCESTMFVWKGKKSGKLERRLAIRCAASLMAEDEARPAFATVVVEHDGSESPLFLHSLTYNAKPEVRHEGKELSSEADAKKIREQRAALRTKLVHLGKELYASSEDRRRAGVSFCEERVLDIDYTLKEFSKYEVWLMLSLEPKFLKLDLDSPLSGARKGVFYRENLYLVLGRDWDSEKEIWRYSIFIWKGVECPWSYYACAMLGFVPKLVKRLVMGSGGNPKSVQVNPRLVLQQCEPEEFLLIFNNKITVLTGNHLDHVGADDDEEEQDEDAKRERRRDKLFRLYMRGHDLRIVELPENEITSAAEVLDSHDSCLLVNRDAEGVETKTGFLWQGLCCPAIAKVAIVQALEELEEITGVTSSLCYDEGINYFAFWDALGGYLKYNRKPGLLPPDVSDCWVCESEISGGVSVRQFRSADVDSEQMERRALVVRDWESSAVYVVVGTQCTDTFVRSLRAMLAQFPGHQSHWFKGFGREARGACLALRRLGHVFDNSRSELMDDDPRISHLRRHHRSTVTGVKLRGPREHVEDEEDEDESDSEEELSCGEKAPEAVPLDRGVKAVDWSKVKETPVQKSGPIAVRLGQYVWKWSDASAVQEADHAATDAHKPDVQTRVVERAPDTEDGMLHPAGSVPPIIKRLVLLGTLDDPRFPKDESDDVLFVGAAEPAAPPPPDPQPEYEDQKEEEKKPEDTKEKKKSHKSEHGKKEARAEDPEQPQKEHKSDKKKKKTKKTEPAAAENSVPSSPKERRHKKADQKPQQQEEEEEDDEALNEEVKCDYCNELTRRNHLRETPLEKDKALEANGLCKSCFDKVVASTPALSGTTWPPKFKSAKSSPASQRHHKHHHKDKEVPAAESPKEDPDKRRHHKHHNDSGQDRKS